MNFLSIYNQYVANEGVLYVYNVKYNNVISFNTTDVEHVKNFLLNSSDPYLVQLGFVNNEEFEKENSKCWYNTLKYSREKLNIMLIMTYDCNCACDYCFEKIDWNYFNNHSCDMDILSDYIINHYKKGKYTSLDLHFFGGEPLLEVDKMIYIYLKLIKSGLNIKPNVITNGVLLNDDIITKLSEVGIHNYQITIDGPREIHDKRRPCKDGSSGWDSIMKNINSLLNYNQSLSIRINIDNENINYLRELYTLIPSGMFEKKDCSVYISPVIGCHAGTAKKTLEERANVLKQAWKIISTDNFCISINPPVYAPCPYHSLESAFYIDLNGNVYSCGGFAGDTTKLQKENYKKTKAFFERIDFSPSDQCLQCPFFPVCMGGCKYETEELNTHCQYSYLKEVYDEYFTKYAKQS